MNEITEWKVSPCDMHFLKCSPGGISHTKLIVAHSKGYERVKNCDTASQTLHGKQTKLEMRHQCPLCKASTCKINKKAYVSARILSII